MNDKEQQFLNELRATFKIEGAEHVDVIASGLIDLEKAPSVKKRKVIIETILREAHSLKGARG